MSFLHICTFISGFFVSVLFCAVLAYLYSQKAVLFHEYQVSTGRFNKIVSLSLSSCLLVFRKFEGKQMTILQSQIHYYYGNNVN